MAAAALSPTGPISQQERVICVLKSPGVPGQYDVISLEEQTTDNEESSFRLSSQSITDVPKTLLDGFLVDSLPEYLRGNDARKVHVVVSTRSGTGRALDFYQSALKPLLERLALSSAETSGAENAAAPSSGTYHVHITQGSQSIQRFARDLNLSLRGIGGSALQHTIILLSGDGGTIELLNGKAPVDEAGVPDESLPLVAMLPLGTGNALFHSMHKPFYAAPDEPEPSPLVLGLRTLLRGKQAPLPSFRVDFSPGSRTISYVVPRVEQQSESGPSAESVVEKSSLVPHLYGVIVASYGFHSQLVWESDTPEYRKHGAKRFQMVAAELLKENHAYHATVELKSGEESAGRKLDRKTHAYILAAMVSNLEKTFAISPASLPLDGKLRLIHFGPVGGQKAMEIMGQVYNNGNHVGMEWTADDGKTVERVGYEEARCVQVTVLEDDPRWRKVCIDGTIVEIPKGGSMSVAKDNRPHLQVVVHQSLNGA